MEILIEVPRSELNNALEIKKEHPDHVDILMTKKFEGSAEALTIILTLTSTFVPIAYDYLMNRRKKDKPGTIKVKGVEYEYDTREELEQIIDSSMKDEEE